MGLEAATKALIDAGITYDKVQAAWVGYVSSLYHSHNFQTNHAPKHARLTEIVVAASVPSITLE